jgi:sensor histidine kinase YesM
MESTKRQWILPLALPNLAVASVVLLQIAWNQIVTTRELLHVLAYDLIYANLVAALGVLLVGVLPQVLVRRKLSMVWTFGLCFLGVIPVGILMVQALLMGIGLVVPQHFWHDYLQTLRVCMPLALVFGSGAIVYGFLRDRVDVMEQTLHEKEIAEERSRKLAVEARLHSLESRIQPHFLFNTLNSISSLIAVNPGRAEQIVGRLAALLRASLDTSNRSLIPLREELAMVESYVDIERARFGDKLRASVDVPAELQSSEVPPMSVQALVENAVKHGVTPQTGGGNVRVTASLENGELCIEVRDSGPGFDLAVVPAGHGLDNLVERLNALFGDKARLNAVRQNGHSVVEMVLPRV